jgi:hypothetical protein
VAEQRSARNDPQPEDPLLEALIALARIVERADRDEPGDESADPEAPA